MSKVVQSLETALNEKLVQISLVGSILFYIVASPAVFDFVGNLVKSILGLVGIEFKLEGSMLVLFHSIVFGGLLYLSTKYILQHVVDVVKK